MVKMRNKSDLLHKSHSYLASK